MNKPTVSAKWINAEAAAIAKHAKESINSWIIAGQSYKYEEAAHKVRVLQDAAKNPNLTERREALRSLGYAA